MSERGMMIQEAVRDMKLKESLRKNEEFRNRKFQQKYKNKEADATAIATTSVHINGQNLLNNYTTDEEECQDVKSDTSGDNSGGEVRQQGIDGELPVHLL